MTRNILEQAMLKAYVSFELCIILWPIPIHYFLYIPTPAYCCTNADYHYTLRYGYLLNYASPTINVASW